jgi:hypothetical protein
LKGDKILTCGMLSLTALCIIIFPLMYFWAVTGHIAFLIASLVMLALQPITFMCFDRQYMESEFKEEKERLK